MASLREIKLKRGRAWQINFYDDGIRKNIYLPDANKAEAQAKKAEIENLMRLKESARAAGKYQELTGRTDQRAISIEDFYKLFEHEKTAEVQNGSMSIETLKRELYPLRLFAEMFPGLSVSSINPANIQRFKEKRAETITPVGVNKDLANLRTCLRFAYQRGYLAIEVYNRVHNFKVEKPLPSYFTPEELDQIEKFMAPDIALFAFRVVKFTGSAGPNSQK